MLHDFSKILGFNAPNYSWFALCLCLAGCHSSGSGSTSTTGVGSALPGNDYNTATVTLSSNDSISGANDCSFLPQIFNFSDVQVNCSADGNNTCQLPPSLTQGSNNTTTNIGFRTNVGNTDVSHYPVDFLQNQGWSMSQAGKPSQLKFAYLGALVFKYNFPVPSILTPDIPNNQIETISCPSVAFGQGYEAGINNWYMFGSNNSGLGSNYAGLGDYTEGVSANLSLTCQCVDNCYPGWQTVNFSVAGSGGDSGGVPTWTLTLTDTCTPPPLPTPSPQPTPTANVLAINPVSSPSINNNAFFPTGTKVQFMPESFSFPPNQFISNPINSSCGSSECYTFYANGTPGPEPIAFLEGLGWLDLPLSNAIFAYTGNLTFVYVYAPSNTINSYNMQVSCPIGFAMGTAGNPNTWLVLGNTSSTDWTTPLPPYQDQSVTLGCSCTGASICNVPNNASYTYPLTFAVVESSITTMAIYNLKVATIGAQSL